MPCQRLYKMKILFQLKKLTQALILFLNIASKSTTKKAFKAPPKFPPKKISKKEFHQHCQKVSPPVSLDETPKTELEPITPDVLPLSFREDHFHHLSQKMIILL